MITEIYIEGQKLDLSQDISAEFTYAIDDIKDFSARNTSFSKTIVLPGNAVNNNLLGHIFKFGNANLYNPAQPNVGYNFNPSISASCIILVDKIQVFKGVLRLLEIIIDGDSIEYECAVFGELGGFISALANKKIEEIDFGIADQTWNVSTITGSWDNISGGGVYYPLIDYGQVSYNNKKDWDFKAFRPALYVKNYMDKIITGAGYTYDAPFFNTNLFKRLIIPNNQKNLTKSATVGFFGLANVKNYSIAGAVEFTVSTLGNFTANITNTVFTYTSATPFTGSINLQIAGIINSISPISDLTLQLRLNTFTILSSVTYPTPGDGYAFNANLSVANTTINQNDFLTVDIIGNFNDLDIQSGVFSISSGTPTDVVINYNESININDTIPKGIFQRDFFASVVKMFNLYVTEDRDRSNHLIIEPYIDYYDVSGSRYDWTYLVDRDKPIRLKPMSELTGRYFEYKYKQDSDYYNDQYFKKFAQGYGDRIEDTGFEFASDKQTAELIFAATPLVGYQGEDKVFSTILKLSNTNVEDKTEHVIRILQAKKLTGLSSYDIMNGMSTTLTSTTSMGYAGHLDDPDNPTADINFGVPSELFFTISTAYPSANLFNGFWSDYVAEITDKNSKLLSCNVLLKTSDIYQLDFSKFVYIDGSLWRINKVADYNPIAYDTTKVELLKVIELTY
jgi:hypothetical protein